MEIILLPRVKGDLGNVSSMGSINESTLLLQGAVR